MNNVITGLDNIITFFGFTTPVILLIALVPAGALPLAILAHYQTVLAARTQVILFQGLVLAEARDATRIQRQSIKVQRLTFDGKPEHARGFLAVLSAYRHLQPGDFPNNETFITWTLACMDGPQVNPWKNALLNRRTTLTAQNLPLPAMFQNFAVFQTEFEGKYMDPNEIKNAGRALMALRQYKSAREFVQEFDRLAEIAGQTGQAFLIDQFRRNLKHEVQEKLLRQVFATLLLLQSAAIEWDDTIFEFKRQQRTKDQSRRPPVMQKQRQPVRDEVPMDLDFTKLAPEELERRKRNRLCFRCGESGHQGRNCPTNKKQPKKPTPKLAAIDRPLSPVSEEATAYEEQDNQTLRGFQDD